MKLWDMAIIGCVALLMGLAGVANAVEEAPISLEVVSADGTVSVLDRAALMALPRASFRTVHPWVGGRRSYEGATMAAVLAMAGVEDGVVRVKALDDYFVDIPVRDLIEHGAVLADLLDGAPMPVRDKGPLWVMYPFDAWPQIDDPLHHTYIVWSVSRIEAQ